MKTVKLTLLLFIFLLIAKKSVIAQNGDEYETFCSLFPIREYPFTLSNDYDKMSSFDTPLKGIPSELAKKNLQSKYFNLRHVDKICKLYGFDALGRFLLNNHKYDLLLVAFDIQEGCGEQVNMAIYDKKGILIDTLVVYGWWKTKLSSVENQRGETCYLDCTIYKDSIVLSQKDYIGDIIRLENKKKKRQIVLSDYVYIIDDTGHFIKIKENRKEDVEIWE